MHRRNFLTVDIYFAQLSYEHESQRPVISIPDVLSKYVWISSLCSNFVIDII